MTKWVTGILFGLLGFLQLSLWFGRGSIQEALQLHDEVLAKTAVVEKLAQSNQVLDREVEALKKDPEAVEERARYQLGMIKQGETFFLLLEPSSSELKR